MNRPSAELSRSPIILLLGIVALPLSAAPAAFFGLLIVGEGYLRSSFSAAAEPGEAHIRDELSRAAAEIESATSDRLRRSSIQSFERKTLSFILFRLRLEDYFDAPLFQLLHVGIRVRFIGYVVAFFAAIAVCLHRRRGRTLVSLCMAVVLGWSLYEAGGVARELPDTMDGFSRDYKAAYTEMRSELEMAGVPVTHMNDVSPRTRVHQAFLSRWWFGLNAAVPTLLLFLFALPPIRRSAAWRPATMAFLLTLLTCMSCSSRPRDEVVTTGLLEADERYSQGATVEARQLFQREMQKNPESHLACIGLARCALRDGNDAAFEEHALRAGILAPALPAAWNRLGILYVQGAERFRESRSRSRYAQVGLEYLRRVFAAAPDTAHLNFHLGLGFFFSDDPLSARLFFQEELRRDPENETTRTLLLATWRKLQQADQIVTHVSQRRLEGHDVSRHQGILEWAEGFLTMRSGRVPATSQPVVAPTNRE